MNLPDPPAPALDSLIDRLQSRLNASATAATREWWTKYLRGAASFRGVKMGDVRTAVHAWFNEEGLGEYLSVGQQKDLALMLLEEDYSEDKLAGVLFLQEILLPEGALEWRSELPRFARLFDQGYIRDWSICDWFCVKVLGPLVEQQGEPCAQAISAWREANTVWQRRASVVAFANLASKGDQTFPGFTEMVLNNCSHLLGSQERFAQTGVGRIFALPPTLRAGVTMGLLWVYILIAGAPPSAIRAGVVATFVLAAPLLGRQVSPLHFMTTTLALVLAYNPQLVYSTGFQLSVAAVFGILLLTRPLKSLVERTLFRPLKSPPTQLSNLISVSLAAQLATSPIVAATFDQVSIVGVFTNLIAVPLSGPILILGLLGSFAGNIYPLLAYPLNACNGFLVTILIQTAQGASSLPFASVTTPGVTLLLVGLFYAGCVPPIVAGRVFSSERRSLWAALLLMWSALWLVLVAAGQI